jgi:hypothetical protein
MFVTGALSTLLPYALFFGMLLVFTVQTYAKPKQQENCLDQAKILQIEQNTSSTISEAIHFYDTINDIEWDIIQPPAIYPELPVNTHKRFIIWQDHFIAFHIIGCRTLRAPPVFA